MMSLQASRGSVALPSLQLPSQPHPGGCLCTCEPSRAAAPPAVAECVQAETLWLIFLHWVCCWEGIAHRSRCRPVHDDVAPMAGLWLRTIPVNKRIPTAHLCLLQAWQRLHRAGG